MVMNDAALRTRNSAVYAMSFASTIRPQRDLLDVVLEH